MTVLVPRTYLTLPYLIGLTVYILYHFTTLPLILSLGGHFFPSDLKVQVKSKNVVYSNDTLKGYYYFNYSNYYSILIEKIKNKNKNKRLFFLLNYGVLYRQPIANELLIFIPNTLNSLQRQILPYLPRPYFIHQLRFHRSNQIVLHGRKSNPVHRVLNLDSPSIFAGFFPPLLHLR